MGINKTQARNYSLDTLKCIMAFFVILIHSNFNGKQHILTTLEIAVPVFFMISGYFFFSNDIKNEQVKIKNSIKKIFKLYIVSTFLYFIWRLFIVSISNYKIEFSWTDIITCENPLGGHLWYLHAYLFMLLIVFVLQKINIHFSNIKYTPIVLMVFLFIISFTSSYFIYIFLYRVLFVALGFWSIGIISKKFKFSRILYY